MLSELIINNATTVALILRILGLFTCIAFILPLMLQEAKVKNGLRPLRWALLLYGTLFSLSNVLSLILLYTAFDTPPDLQSALLRIINALFVFALNMLGYAMYHWQFSPDMIVKHRKFENFESKLAKKKK